LHITPDSCDILRDLRVNHNRHRERSAAIFSIPKLLLGQEITTSACGLLVMTLFRTFFLRDLRGSA